MDGCELKTIKATAGFTSSPPGFTGVLMDSWRRSWAQRQPWRCQRLRSETNPLWQRGCGFLGKRSPSAPCKHLLSACVPACFVLSRSAAGMGSHVCGDLGTRVEWGKATHCAKWQMPVGSLLSIESDYPTKICKSPPAPQGTAKL